MAWATFVLLNLGLLLRALGEPAIVPLLGRLAEVGAALAFTLHAWPRVKALG
jgi:hypothetical protein